MHPFSNPWKHQGEGKGCLGNEWVNCNFPVPFNLENFLSSKVLTYLCLIIIHMNDLRYFFAVHLGKSMIKFWNREMCEICSQS